jgi:VanZ family protein
MLLIVYGSLYPFQFQHCTGSLLATSGIPANRGDLLSNILLYLPLGFFGRNALSRSRWSVAVVTLAGAALSFALESIQRCDAERVSSMADVYANAGGTLLGSLLAVAWGARVNAAVLLAACWVASRVLPYVPSPHVEKYRAAIRALFVAPGPLDVFHYFALWMAAAAVFEALGVRRGLLAVIVAVMAARIVVVDVSPVSAEVLGALLAFAAWNGAAPMRGRAIAVAIIFTAYVVVNALEPFQFLREPRAFGWTPFLSFMRSPRESASRVFLEKSFMYGALVWLAARAGISFGLAAAGGSALVFILRVAQVYLPGRSAEITDALMVLMAAAAMRLIGD